MFNSFTNSGMFCEYSMLLILQGELQVLYEVELNELLSIDYLHVILYNCASNTIVLRYWYIHFWEIWTSNSFTLLYD